MDAHVASVAAPVERLSRRAWGLAVITLVYNFAEGVAALWIGHASSSWGIVSFGIDAVAESLSGAVILWRFAPQLKHSERRQYAQRESRAVRLIGISFVLLAAVIAGEALQRLWGSAELHVHGLAFYLAGLSLCVKPLLFWAKWRLGGQLQSESLRADAKQTLACAGLSAAVLVGLMAYRWGGIQQADALLALLIAAALLREGVHALRHRHILCCSDPA